VLAAGASRRLGQPKQLLPFGAGTLLDHTLGVARRCGFDQALCVIGGGGPDVRDRVDLGGFTVVENPAYGEGCSSSIAAALAAVDPRADALVLMLGDQPGVTPCAVRALIAGRGGAALAACAYADGRGHPFAFARSTFAELADLHGDKGVWKLMDRAGDAVRDVRVSGAIPPDVDTWDDYATVLANAGLPRQAPA
jgi:molybdenum cofactor cytidylyltransferase